MRRILMLALVIGTTLLLTTCGKPDNTAIGYWDKAIALSSQSDYDEAIQQYEKLVKYFPDDSLAIPAMFTIADIYKNNLNNAKKAIKVYEKVIKDYKGTESAVNAHFMIGYVYANDIKDLDKAEKYYKSFIKKYPENILVPSAEWELRHLGKTIEEIPELQSVTQSEK